MLPANKILRKRFVNEWLANHNYKTINSFKLATIKLLQNNSKPGMLYYDFPLQEALNNNDDLYVIGSLLSEGLDPNLYVKTYTYPPLFILLMKEWTDNTIPLLKLLIKYNVNITHIDKYGDSALHKIAYNMRDGRSSQLMKILISNGADIKLKNNEGRTPYDCAMHNLEWFHNKQTILKSGIFRLLNNE